MAQSAYALTRECQDGKAERLGARAGTVLRHPLSPNRVVIVNASSTPTVRWHRARPAFTPAWLPVARQFHLVERSSRHRASRTGAWPRTQWVPPAHLVDATNRPSRRPPSGRHGSVQHDRSVRCDIVGPFSPRWTRKRQPPAKASYKIRLNSRLHLPAPFSVPKARRDIQYGLQWPRVTPLARTYAGGPDHEVSTWILYHRLVVQPDSASGQRRRDNPSRAAPRRQHRPTHVHDQTRKLCSLPGRE